MSSAPATAAARPEAARRPDRRLGPPTPRVALLILAVVVVGVVLYLGRHALTPFLVGALLIYILDPAVSFLARLRLGPIRIPRWLAVLIVYALTFFVVAEAVMLLFVPLVAQIGQFVGDLPRIFSALEGALAQLGEFYRTLELPPALRDVVDDLLAGIGEGAPGLDLGALLPLARGLLGTVAGFFGFLIIPVWAFYILRDRVQLSEQIHHSLPPAWREDAWAVLHIIDRVFGRWIRAQIVLGVIVGAATYLGLLVLGNVVDSRFLEFAVLLAVIAGVLELLPIIGPIIAMIPALLIGLTTADPIVALVAVLILYIAVQQVENAVLVPKIQGEAVELHPSLIIFALIVGGAIAGLPGAILSVPLTAAARNVYRYLFRRLSEDDPAVPPADAPDLRPLIVDEPADVAAEEQHAAGGASIEGHSGTGGPANVPDGHVSPGITKSEDEVRSRSRQHESKK